MRYLAAASITLLLAMAVAPAQDAGRPNVLFLFADDQRPDAVGAFGNEHVKTPNLDRLAARAFRFSEAHCMGSRHGAVCAPSRAMLMSGRTLHRVKDSIEGAPTFPEVLGRAGYATFATGKWHNGRPSLSRSFQEGRAVFLGGMCDHFHVPLIDLVDGEFEGKRTGDKHSSELFADAAIDFLERRAKVDDDRPFLAYVAFTAPHDPRDAPKEYRERWYQHRPPVPPNFRPQHHWNVDEGTLTLRDEVLAAWPRDPETIRDQLAEYYALIEHLDSQIGRVLAALDRLGFTRDTVVVFAADHGLALGSHGLLGKQSLYEHSMGLPMLIAGPGIEHGSSAALVYLFDVFPTLCAMTGVGVPDGVEGQDLGPVLRGEVDGVRDSMFTLYRDNLRAIRDERWKLIRFTKTGKTLLFDLENDPYELHDLAGEPEQQQRVQELLALMEAWQEQAADTQALIPEDPLPLTIDLAGRARKPDRWQPEWIRRKYFDDGGR